MTVSSAIWRDQLSEAERATLGRGDGRRSGAAPDLLVVGGGIRASRPRPPATRPGLGPCCSIETGRLGAGATGGATGLLIPEPHQWSDPEPFVDLERASLAALAPTSREPSRRGRAGRAWTGSGWPRTPAGFAAHQPPAVEWLEPGSGGAAGPRPGPAHGGRAHPAPGPGSTRCARWPGSPPGLPAVATGVAATGVTVPGRPDRERGHVRRPRSSRGRWSSPPGCRPCWTAWTLDVPSERVKGHLLVTEPDAGSAAGHRGAGRDPAGRRAAARRRDLRHGRREPGGPAGGHRLILAGLAATLPRAARAACRLLLVLFPAPASRPPAGHRPDSTVSATPG